MSVRKTFGFVLLAAGVPALVQGQGVKIDSTTLLSGGERGTQFVVSPKGQHLAAIMLRGSRKVVVYDGTDGPRFDDINATSNNSLAAFSDDGEHYAYAGRLGQEWVLMVDGKEHARGTPYMSQSSSAPSIRQFGFSPGGGKHFWYLLEKTEGSRTTYQTIVDGKPGPAGEEPAPPTFSKDGEHHLYLHTVKGANGYPVTQWVVDGKPSLLKGDNAAFTSDGLHIITQLPVPRGGGYDVLADGRPLMRVTGAQIHMAPKGPGFLAVVWTPFVNGARQTFLTAGNQKIPGSECLGTAGINHVYFTEDAKHYAVSCQNSNTAYWVMADGKKGQEYRTVSDVVFTADGRPVYSAHMNNKYFMVVGQEESEAYDNIQGEAQRPRDANLVQNYFNPPAVVAGNHVGFIGFSSAANRRDVVIDGKKVFSSTGATDLRLSPDGTRYAFLTFPSGIGVDGAILNGFSMTGEPQDMRRISWSPDSKHVAFAASHSSNTSARGVGIDGKFLAIGPFSPYNLTWTPDSRHLIWHARHPNGAMGFYLDGELILEADQTNGLEQSDAWWTMAADGTLTFIAQQGDAMKRYKVTPGTATSIETMLRKAK